MSERIDFQVDPTKMKHWKVTYDGAVAYLYMDVDEDGGLFEGYQLKLNSYDLGVDIELADVVQRMRFEHPEVKVVVLGSAKEKVFCAGANIRMLGSAAHAHKVNFCKFTNETRNTFEAALQDSGQNYICAVRGACAGGGYELALACNHIMLTDDSTSSVALPEVPLLAVLPGTGGLTRVTDKRKLRRDLADVFCSVEEGVKGKRAVEWRLVDEVIPNSKFEETVRERARGFAEASDKPDVARGITLKPLDRVFATDSVTYSTLDVKFDRPGRRAVITIRGPNEDAPIDMATFEAEGSDAWMLRCARELDDAILHLRTNEGALGLIEFQTIGDPARVVAHEALLLSNREHWLANEVVCLWKRVLKRVDMTSRSLVALVEHGSCFAGVLAELLWAVDRSYMMLDPFEDDDRRLAAITLTPGNFGQYVMSNGLSRLQTRFWGTPDHVETMQPKTGVTLDAEAAEVLGLVTYAFDDIDWEDEVRLFREERASFSADAMTGMEANLRFAGPETMETRIFGRLTAWQNWIFQRPNAVGPEGALQRYGTGMRAVYDMQRV
ncbi:2,3-epoxybenzoyl-CoA dihydrolase [uncultured Roseobacter sp.]|uniref:2,3-epoxybenzoyl-CoA dihydrolase n=1 Tax=uncultured Roseobacter sp. TaxID=114847 RepID=UPI002609A579|nr:2,3-epoxybenzoyl-CoA dihydrolase [uncultured Roseobacter sp.]